MSPDPFFLSKLKKIALSGHPGPRPNLGETLFGEKSFWGKVVFPILEKCCFGKTSFGEKTQNLNKTTKMVKYIAQPLNSLMLICT
jgi:hypothetical protein